MIRAPSEGVAPVLLADGRPGVVRPLEPSDEAGLLALGRRSSDESIYRRFFAVGHHQVDAYTHRLCHEAGVRDRALVLVVEGQVLGVGTADDVAPGVAEVSFMVEELWHGHGVGTLLLEHLAAAQRRRGTSTFRAEVLSHNVPMLRVFAAAGFQVVRHDDDGVATLQMETFATDAAVEATDARERQAETRSLQPLLSPKVVAVVGAGRRRGGTGREVLENIVAGAYTGKVVAINPSAQLIGDVTCYPDLGSVPGHVDLAVAAVPASALDEVVDDACRAGVGALVILTAGLAEAGPEGRKAQDALVGRALAGGIRVVGPNCLGVLNTDPDVSLNATFARGAATPGGLAAAVQSGGIGIALLDAARRAGLGVGRLVTLGNKADVSGNDLLAAWTDDPGVTAGALYLESFGNPSKFARLAARFSRAKPLFAVRSGTSEAGRRAGTSHTAAAATPATAVEALFAATGVIAVDDVFELVDAARLLAAQPLPGGPRLAVVSNAGGLGIVAADAARRAGLDLAPFSGSPLDQPGNPPTELQNPADLGAGATPEAVGRVAAAVFESTQVDAALFVVATTRASDTAALLDRIGAEAATAHSRCPVALVVVGLENAPHEVAGIPVFESVNGATRALGHAVRYARWRATPPGVGIPPNSLAREQGLALAATALPQGGWLDEATASGMLAAYGVPVVPSTLADTCDAAVIAARRIGGPVVVKAADATAVHKTELGLVRTGLVDERDIRRVVGEMAVAQGRQHAPVLVQAQIEEGVEIAVGMVRDPIFGPLVMLAAGGVTTDILDDRTFLLTPVTDVDAARAVRTLRLWPLIDGFRGSPRCDVEAVERVIQAVAQLATDVPQLVELDLNPIIVTARGVICVDVKARVDAASVAAEVGPR